MSDLTKHAALAMLPIVLKFLRDADTPALVKDAGEVCRKVIPDAGDRKRVAIALGGIAQELER